MNIAETFTRRCIMGENDALRAENTELRAALKPFAAAVYNDNGDMTITPCSVAEYAKAYFVLRRLNRAARV